jgi:hypothetical protein
MQVKRDRKQFLLPMKHVGRRSSGTFREKVSTSPQFQSYCIVVELDDGHWMLRRFKEK